MRRHESTFLAPSGLRRLLARPYLVLGLTTLMWGGNAVAGRLAVGEVSPMALTAFRWFVAVLVLALVARREIAAARGTLRPHLPRLFLMGALGYTAFNAIYYWSAHHTTAVNLGVIQGVTPALVMGGSALFHRIPIRSVQVLGLAVTLVGVALVASRGHVEVLASLALNVGDVGIFLASVLYAGYTLGLRAKPPLPPLVFFAAMAAAAFLTSLPLVAAEVAMGLYLPPTATGWGIIAFVGLMPSLLAQLLYIRGVELIGPDRAGLFMNLVPVTAALLAVAILGETFAAYHAVALTCVLGGIWLAERKA